jgi:hypothetical protein
VKDETYAFISDVKDKGITARSARHTRTHCGKGGRVRLPSDNLSKKELQKMNGEVKRYRLNDPMAWKEFKSMPDDLKITYIKLLRKKFNVPGSHIAKMMGISTCRYSQEVNRLGISEGLHSRGRCTPWDKEGFLAWWHGVDMLPTPVPEEIPVKEEPTQEEPETFVEDDLPFEEPQAEPDPIQTEESMTVKAVPVCATPCNGSMNFKCPADQALNTLAQILGKANCAISVMWKVIEEGGEEDDA